MDFIDLKNQQRRIKAALDAGIGKVLAHGNYIMGPEIKELEAQLAAYVGVKHAVACASGTDALLMALMAYNVGPGDAIFTTPFTFIATAEVISLLGATPVFVDIDPRTYNMDPARLEAAIAALQANDPSRHPLPLAPSARQWATGDGNCKAAPVAGVVGGPSPTAAPLSFSPVADHPAYPAAAHSSPLIPRGIIPVDLFGLCADYDAITAIAARHGLFVIEDAAQSFGAEYKGKKSCSFGDIACTSFFPAKPLGCYGDGGMCFTDDDALAAALDSIRVHGKGRHKYDNARIGINGRLDTLQAAILLAKFAIFPEEVELRNEVAARYTELIGKSDEAAPATGDAVGVATSESMAANSASVAVAAAGNPPPLVTPHIPAGYRSVWAQYSVLATNAAHRAALMDKLQAAGIPTAIYYPKPLHLQAAFASLGYQPGAFPVTEDAAGRIFSLPMHPYLSAADQKRIISAAQVSI